MNKESEEINSVVGNICKEEFFEIELERYLDAEVSSKIQELLFWNINEPIEECLKEVLWKI